jgi:hypothetical protein
MRDVATAALCFLLVAQLISSDLQAGNSADLERSITRWFGVNVREAAAPVLQPLNGDIAASAREVRDEMRASGALRAECVISGVRIIWSSASAALDQPGAILLVTGADGESGASVEAFGAAQHTAVYAVGGNGAKGPGGNSLARNDSAIGTAGAWGGERSQGHVDGYALAGTEDSPGASSGTWLSRTLGCAAPAAGPTLTLPTIFTFIALALWAWHERSRFKATTGNSPLRGT